jgi:DNA-binding NarL/FixJ family response regulator
VARRTPTTVVSRDPQLRARLMHTLRRNPDLMVVDTMDTVPDGAASPTSPSTLGPTGAPAAAGSAAIAADGLGTAEMDGAHVAVIAVEAIDAEAMRLIRLHRRHKGRRVVVAAGQLDPVSVCDALDAGATSFLRLAPATAEELVRTVLEAARGEDSVPVEMLPGVLHGLERLARRQQAYPGAQQAGFTDREVTVLRLLAEGWAVAEIAREMSYSERTIKNIVHDITVRLGLRNRTQAVAVAVRTGVI